MNRPLPLNRLVTSLEKLGLGPFLAGLIEAGAGLLGFLAAQSLYIAQPALGVFVDESRLTGLAHWLDDPEALSGLAESVRQDAAGE